MLPLRSQWSSGLGLEGVRASVGISIAIQTRLHNIRKSSSCVERPKTSNSRNGGHSPQKAWSDRLQEIKNTCPEPYPRLSTDRRRLTLAEFRSRYGHLDNNETVEGEAVVVYGRIRTYRLAGSKLIFFDIVHNGDKVQVMCNLGRLTKVTQQEFKQLYRLLRRGDAFSVAGRPHRTGRGELTVEALQLPRLLSPCLHDVPVDAHSHENSPYPRHVQFLADQGAADVLRARSAIIEHIRQFFLDRSFMEVSTPILASVAGGAIARPFYTSATEFPERQLSLRIAPELWLKRLVVGGFDRVFEIGPSFRNEGLDKTHNPEFTTCEFYHAYANLDDLISITESLLSSMAERVRRLNEQGTLTPTNVDFSSPFRRLDFIPALEQKTGRKLPDLTQEDAVPCLLRLFDDLSLPRPEQPTLLRLLDVLCATYLEPQCHHPTFIINPPECLSPLSKSYLHPFTNQRVAARAELFIEGKEVVNTYEEENSPFEQRRKFLDQARLGEAAGDYPAEIDERYLEALEWGLPPTGGWGCGIDRLCMLFTGAKRISDVLPFGSLRAVTRRRSGHGVSGQMG